MTKIPGIQHLWAARAARLMPLGEPLSIKEGCSRDPLGRAPQPFVDCVLQPAAPGSKRSFVSTDDRCIPSASFDALRTLDQAPSRASGSTLAQEVLP